jgi:CRISPR-associated protein Cmr2
MNHLIQINLGPVQGFIATARRSRDLWFGSYILSELSKSVALSLHRHQAKLIFPFVDNLETQLTADSDFLVTNIVFAELETVDLNAARAVLGVAQQAARNRWKNLCDQAQQQIEKAQGKAQGTAEKLYDSSIWQAQLGDVVEIYSGIVPIGTEGYAQANNHLREMLANRKNTRSFTPYSDHFRRPKSSLDGAQSSVLNNNASSGVQRLRQRLGIEKAEQLDTAAMVKRVVGRERGFVPTARVAAHAWIERVNADQHSQPQLQALQKQLATLAEIDQGTKLGQRYAEYDWLKTLPFDGQLLYRHRIEAEKARLSETGYADDKQAAEDALQKLDRTLADLYKQHGAPNPYYGLLLADGDKMGQLIDKANAQAQSGEGHRDISKALSAFAQSVPNLMSEHQGACIYSGGDDVLGLVPLGNAVATAQALRQVFKNQLDKVGQQNGIEEHERPTLSVGIALVHFLHPLGDARQLAAQAEKIAKGSALAEGQQRNALCLLAQPRSGNAISVRVRWSDTAAIERLATWTDQLRNGHIPRGLPHELQTAYDNCLQVIPPTTENFETFKAYWRAQLSAILNKKQGQGDALKSEIKNDLLTQLCDESLTLANVNNLAPLQHLLMARWLSGQTEINEL